MERQAAEAQRYAEAWDGANGENDSESSGGSSSGGGKTAAKEKEKLENEMHSEDADAIKEHVAEVLKRSSKSEKPVKIEKNAAVKREAKKTGEAARGQGQSSGKVSERVKPVPEEKHIPEESASKAAGKRRYVDLTMPAAMVSDPVTAKSGQQFVRVKVPVVPGPWRTMTAAAKAVTYIGRDRIQLHIPADHERTLFWRDRSTHEQKRENVSPERLERIYKNYNERLKRRREMAEDVSSGVNMKQTQSGVQLGDN